jgi:hypothetical protein
MTLRMTAIMKTNVNSVLHMAIVPPLARVLWDFCFVTFCWNWGA